MDYKQLIAELMTPSTSSDGQVVQPSVLRIRAARALATLLDLNAKNFDLVTKFQNRMMELDELLDKHDPYKEFSANLDYAREQYLDANNKDYG